MNKSYKELLSEIKTFVFDVDGVMTDGSITIFPSGEFVRVMNVKDGFAMQLAVKRGFRIIVITGAKDDSVKIRLNKLGITDVVLNAHEKLPKLEDFVALYDLKPSEILYMGDDVPDIDPMNAVGLPCCPSDACVDVKQISKYISPIGGGKGCVRDVIEQVLKVQKLWSEDDFRDFNA